MSWPIWRIGAETAAKMRVVDMGLAGFVSILIVPLVLSLLSIFFGRTISPNVGYQIHVVSYMGTFGLFGVPVSFPLLLLMRKWRFLGLVPTVITASVSWPFGMCLFYVVTQGVVEAMSTGVGTFLLVAIYGTLYGGLFWLVLRVWRPSAFRRPKPLVDVFE